MQYGDEERERERERKREYKQAEYVTTLEEIKGFTFNTCWKYKDC